MERILDWNKYIEKAVDTVAEGIVMVKNDNNALPLDKNEEISIFGRIQLHYYKSGTGSGGMVNVSKVVNIVEGLLEKGIKLNQELLDVYKKWDIENPFDIGKGWGTEPWSQTEMPIEDSLVERASQTSETAIVVIGRTAGEEQDNKAEAGSYFLSEPEMDMLRKVRKNFPKVIVLLNVGNIIDMKFFEECVPDSILYIWQGGMTGGTGTAAVLTGEKSPSGKLTDTIAKNIEDYPSHPYFGNDNRNFYSEDIFVGYRYFETFAQNKVMYPFGFGLSYTEFEITSKSVTEENDLIKFTVSVKNTGKFSGKEVVQVYCQAPQGKLGKAAKVLCGFCKTDELAPGESQCINIDVSREQLASYDDSGITGVKNAFLLEEGDYIFHLGTDVRSSKPIYTINIKKLTVISRHSQALAPVVPFSRFHSAEINGKPSIEMETVPLSEVDETQRRIDNLPEEIPYTGNVGITLSDVHKGKNSMEEFIAQLSDYDLSCIIRGEGMGSPRVTPGTASAFGGISDELTALGIPAACCDDGPSGMRLDCGTKAFSLPNGTMIASTFNRQLITELFSFMGLEMSANKVDCLLGPGMNIHRHPLNGRNFEYFSEDPFLTGTMAVAELKGLHSSGVTGTIKHFCGNNQEKRRHFVDSVISERALREIYLKGFEIAVKSGEADSIMTTYGPVNGLWTSGNYDLNTTILRNEWKFKGFTMTDWWPNINERNVEHNKTNFAAMAIAQNDIYMVCTNAANNDDNTLEALKNGKLNRSELQRNAGNICRFLLTTEALKRLEGTYEPVNIINRPEEEVQSEEPVIFYDINKELTIKCENVSTKKGSNYSFALVVTEPGMYKVTITASSEASELAQIPVTLFGLGTAHGSFTWNGTNGKPVSYSVIVPMYHGYKTMRLYFAESGLDLHSINIQITDKKFNL